MYVFVTFKLYVQLVLIMCPNNKRIKKKPQNFL
jgi:hypothetical protein